MRFETVRLIVIRNRSKRTISISGGLGLLQMISESDISEDIGPSREMDHSL